MHFGFALELSDIDLWNIDLLDTHLDLLDTDIPSKYFVCLHSVFRTSSRYVFKTSSRHVFKTSWRCLQRNNFSSSKTSSTRLARCLQDVFKTSWKTCNCYTKNVLKTTSRHFLRKDVLKTSSRPTNVCWDVIWIERVTLNSWPKIIIFMELKDFC